MAWIRRYGLHLLRVSFFRHPRMSQLISLASQTVRRLQIKTFHQFAPMADTSPKGMNQIDRI